MHRDLYELLIARARCDDHVRRLLLGLSWSLCSARGLGVCFSPLDAPRTLPWSGTLRGTSSAELVPWIRSFDSAQAAVGVATLNACLNHADNPLLARAHALSYAVPAHLRVFAHFTDAVRGSHVTVVGRYPGLDQLWSGVPYRCLERRPGPDVLPDSAAEYVLPRSDWVFVTGSALANKTLPRLLELSRRAKVVLMGPSVPWLADWSDFGVDYLAGVHVDHPDSLWQTAEEGGGTRIFETGLSYRLLTL